MTTSAARRRTLAAWLLFGCGIWAIGLGLYFIFWWPALLPEDLRYIGLDPNALGAAAPGLERWLGKVFIVTGGFMASAGVLIAYVALRIPCRSGRETALVLGLAGSLGFGLMSAGNFVLRSDFRWLLLVPAVTWLFALVLQRRER